jgi:hypothetical protein
VGQARLILGAMIASWEMSFSSLSDFFFVLFLSFYGVSSYFSRYFWCWADGRVR